MVQLGEMDRYAAAPRPGKALTARPMLYFVDKRRDQSDAVRKVFSRVSLATELSIRRQDAELSRYAIYLVEAPKGPVMGRMP